MSGLHVNQFGEIPCSICGFNEGMPGANMVHICGDCRQDMREQTRQQFHTLDAKNVPQSGD